MRAVKAKALRKALGFHPGQPREYDAATPRHRIYTDVQGKPQTHVVTGTITATGQRRNNQSVKRNSTLARMVLAAPKLEVAHG